MKYCSVPYCNSSSAKTPNKLFIMVPRAVENRKKWFKLAGEIDAHKIPVMALMYFCEDHFDLQKDMVNYMQYHVMGSVSKIIMKKDCIPTKFECQTQFMSTIAEEQNCSKNLDSSAMDISDTEKEQEDIIQKTADKCVQFNYAYKYRSKAVQASVETKNKALSPMKATTMSSSTSPFKISICSHAKPSTSGSNNKKQQFIRRDPSDSDISLYVPSTACNSTLSATSFLNVSLSDCCDMKDKESEAKANLMRTMLKIKRKPRFYIGVPKSCYKLIDILCITAKQPIHHILFCLHKIRLDGKLFQLSDDYSMSVSYLSKVFSKCIPKIASLMLPFLVTLNPELITKFLPMPFRLI